MIREGDRGDRPMSDRMIRTQLMNLLVAGNETTRNLLGSLFYLLATDPELDARLRADRSLIANFIEETLRLEPPVRFLVRRCAHDTTLQGTPLESGATMLLSFESSNRDGAAIERPDELDLARPNPREHLSFGAGAHICPGAFLARLEAQVVLETYFDVVETMRLAEGAVYEPHPVYWARGPVSLTVVLTPSRNDGRLTGE
jgi:cytochrome P450